MSLIVEVYIGSERLEENRKKVARMVLHNVSDLADVSDYEGWYEEYGKRILNISDFHKDVEIKQHDRKQSVWELIKRALNG